MKGCMTTDLGIITVDPEVIAKYAGTVAVECFGIVGMAALNVKDGLVHLLKKESLTRGIQVKIDEDNHIKINFHIIVAYGVSISAVTENLIKGAGFNLPAPFCALSVLLSVAGFFCYESHSVCKDFIVISVIAVRTCEFACPHSTGYVYGHPYRNL